jgi:hypothetical protein
MFEKRVERVADVAERFGFPEWVGTWETYGPLPAHDTDCWLTVELGGERLVTHGKRVAHLNGWSCRLRLVPDEEVIAWMIIRKPEPFKQ